MNLIKSCCLFVVFSSFLACTSQVSDVKSVSYTEFVNPFIGTDIYRVLVLWFCFWRW